MHDKFPSITDKHFPSLKVRTERGYIGTSSGQPLFVIWCSGKLPSLPVQVMTILSATVGDKNMGKRTLDARLPPNQNPVDPTELMQTASVEDWEFVQGQKVRRKAFHGQVIFDTYLRHFNKWQTTVGRDVFQMEVATFYPISASSAMANIMRTRRLRLWSRSDTIEIRSTFGWKLSSDRLWSTLHIQTSSM